MRMTVPLLRRDDAPIFLSTHFPEQDREFGVDRLVDQLIPADFSWITKERQAETFEEKEHWARHMYRDALRQIDRDTVCIGIGGDNYCYPNWHRQSLFHNVAKERGATSLLWGCSIQPEMIEERMEAVLQSHDHIYARESETYRALLAHGISKVTLLPDPAFSLAPSFTVMPAGFVPGNTAAINLSPLVVRRSKEVLSCFADAAHHLLQNAEALLLIPHVTMPSDNDYEALSALERCLSPKDQKRICRLDRPQNAAQLKYVISQCEILICSRTHASIAGYSSGVPTLVLGYSIKSAGIGRDLKMEHWVLPLEECNKLPEMAVGLWNKRLQIRNSLIDSMGTYQRQLTTKVFSLA